MVSAEIALRAGLGPARALLWCCLLDGCWGLLLAEDNVLLCFFSSVPGPCLGGWLGIAGRACSAVTDRGGPSGAFWRGRGFYSVVK